MDRFDNLISVTAKKEILLTLLVYPVFLLMAYLNVGTSQLSPLTLWVCATIWFTWLWIHCRLLFHRLLFKGKYVGYVSLLILGIVLTSVAQVKVVEFFNQTIQALWEAVRYNTGFTFFYSLFYLGILYLWERKKFYQLDALRKEIELNQLKSQLNPHFLFNALNNIYSYGLQGENRSNELVLKLSHLMRYILESSAKETITITEELDFIDDYIEFEKERLGYRCDIIFQKHVKYLDRRIPPLLIFTFVENAFKHGTNSIDAAFVEISLVDDPNKLQLRIRNRILQNGKASTKVGLVNARKRLELLFPSKYDFRSAEIDGHYHVELDLQYHEN